MSTDFGTLLFRFLPGLYRDKDEGDVLRRFLEIMAQPLAELEASIEQLHEDTFVERCRGPLVPLIGDLVGADVDPTQPERAQRAEVRNSLAFYRSKGLGESLGRFVEDATGWRATLVDFSDVVAQVPAVSELDPLVVLRERPIAETPAGSGRFHFDAGGGLTRLFDATRGRPITRRLLAADPARFAGQEGRFGVWERGEDLLMGSPPRYRTVAADLSDFAAPRAVDGTPLVLASGDVAVDPELGRFLFGGSAPLAGNLRATYVVLRPASIRTQAFHVGDSSRMRRLGRADDPAPYSIDVGAPRRVTDRNGQKHFDNHGIFLTPARVLAQRRPNALPPGSESGRFSFDDSALALSDTEGVSLQLLDGLDGSPITRKKLAAFPSELFGAPRGFTLRVGSTTLGEARPDVRLVAANLANFVAPKAPDGTALTLLPTDVAIDPELGRIRLDLTALGLRAEELRVDYLLANVAGVDAAKALALSSGAPELFAFAPDGAHARPRDRRDGTPLAVALRLGRPLSSYYGTPRGFTLRRNGAPLTAALTPDLVSLDEPAATVAAGRVAVDLERGRFQLPSGSLASGDVVTVDYGAADVAESRVFESLAQRLARALPAGVVPVIVDTRRSPVNPAKVS